MLLLLAVSVTAAAAAAGAIAEVSDTMSQQLLLMLLLLLLLLLLLIPMLTVQLLILSYLRGHGASSTIAVKFYSNCFLFYFFKKIKVLLLYSYFKGDNQL